jgi:hypothetical protein
MAVQRLLALERSAGAEDRGARAQLAARVEQLEAELAAAMGRGLARPAAAEGTAAAVEAAA